MSYISDRKSKRASEMIFSAETGNFADVKTEKYCRLSEKMEKKDVKAHTKSMARRPLMYDH